MGAIGDGVTARTWQLICDDKAEVFGLGAFENDDLRGILHYVLHPTTGSLFPACYMQDLFTDPPYRSKGIAMALLKELKTRYHNEKWARIYWVAEENNIAAQKLYQKFGVKLDFTFHVLI